MITSYQGELRRKLTHYLASLIPIIAYFMEKNTALLILSAIFIVFFIVEILRMRYQFFRNIFLKFFGGIVRENEEKNNAFTGAMWVFLAAPLTLFLFPKPVAVCALLFLTIGDASAALIGKKYGRIRLLNKTLEGSLAFIGSSILATLWIIDLPVTIKIYGAIIAAIVELLPSIIDDNLTIPLISASVMALILAV